MKTRHLCMIILLLATAAAGLSTVSAGAPTGAGPNDPLMITATPQTVAPNASLWFYFEYTGVKSRIRIWLDDNGARDVDLALYTPDQADKWVLDPTTAPVGRGAKPGSGTSIANHDLAWEGAFNAAGRYRLLVTNRGADPVSVKLTVQGDYVSLAPTVLPTPTIGFTNPRATPVPTGNITGRILFQQASGGNIYTVNGDGSQLARVANGLDPAWSADGQRIAYVRWGNPGSGLYVAQSDGSQERLVLGTDQLRGPQWSPDGTRLVFFRQKGGTVEDVIKCFGSMCFTIRADPYWKLGVVEVNSGNLTEPRCSTHCLMPTWSTDNHSITYYDGALGLMGTSDIGGTTEYQINLKVPLTESPQYSPDGTLMVMQIWAHDHWDIDVTTPVGKSVTRLTTRDLMAFKTWNNVAPTWSPDGKQILFLSDRNGKWEFYAINTDGSGLKQVLKSVSDAVPIQYNFVHEHVMDWR